jgi:stage IV sporulation protein FB
MDEFGVTLRGCNFRTDFFSVAILVFILLLDRDNRMNFSILSIAIHELGHILAMYRLGCAPREIKFSLFSVDIKNKYIMNSKKDKRIAFAGPFANFIAGAAFFSFYIFFKNAAFFSLSAINFTLALFNLLPIKTLDGGQILFGFLSRKFSVTTAEKILFVSSILCIFPLSVLSFSILLRSKYNFSLLFLSCYLLYVILSK